MSRSEAGGPGRAAAQGSEVDGSQAGTPKGTATAGSEAAELRAGPEGNLDGGAGHINLGSVPSKQDQDASSGRASEVCFPYASLVTTHLRALPLVPCCCKAWHGLACAGLQALDTQAG